LAKKIFFIVLILLVAGASGLGLFLYNSLKPVDPLNKRNIQLTVTKGESLDSVLELLEEKNLIKHANIYKVYSRFIRPINIKIGIYNVQPSMTGLEMLRILEEGKQELIKITIPEGLTSNEIVKLFEEKGIVTHEDFMKAMKSRPLLDTLNINEKTAEGYLFPDTYYFQKNFPAEKVLEYMVQTFYRNLKEIYPFYKELSSAKLREKLILASIVEKEYRVAEEAPVIASVFNNRLKIGMPLQSCATVIYVITEELGKPHPDRVFFKDLEIPSDFNTYLNKSLPPKPICNPGRTALNAAFNPAQTDYLFFVVKDSEAGTHTFTSTLADHNAARQSYIQGFRSK